MLIDAGREARPRESDMLAGRGGSAAMEDEDGSYGPAAPFSLVGEARRARLDARLSDGLGGSSGSGERWSRFVPDGAGAGGRVGVASHASGRVNIDLKPEKRDDSEPERVRLDVDCDRRLDWKAEGDAAAPLPVTSCRAYGRELWERRTGERTAPERVLESPRAMVVVLGRGKVSSGKSEWEWRLGCLSRVRYAMR